MNTPVADVLRTKGNDIYSIAPDGTLFDAVKEMSARHAGSLVVFKDGGRLAGIVSERDFRDAVIEGKDLRKVRVREVMSKKVVMVPPDAAVETCMELMTEKRVRHLPVVKDDKVIGVISIGDLVKYICDTRGIEIDNLEKYITGSL
ncbi:MAG: CBS domain-containing protein [Kiritimatiellae bacterium]|nr:CBS domain-containing protein [Kiritimatiellia bacterium]